VIQKSGPNSTKKKLLIGGLAAGAIAVAVSLLVRLFAGGLFLPEIASQTLFSLTPGQIESRAVESLGRQIFCVNRCRCCQYHTIWFDQFAIT